MSTTILAFLLGLFSGALILVAAWIIVLEHDIRRVEMFEEELRQLEEENNAEKTE